MARQKTTISEGLSWLKILQKRQQELIGLRDGNANLRYAIAFGTRDTQEKIEPVYDAKDLDKRVTLLAREIRLCDTAIKRMNARVTLEGYEMDDDVLGELA